MNPEREHAGKGIDRRSFLAAAGLAPLVLGAAPPPRKLRAGFLGLGYSHATEKVRLIRESEDYECIGAWAETPELERTWAARGLPMLSKAQVLERAEVILVESEVARHAPLAREALAAGRHVHVEKPPALRLDELDALIQLARARSLQLQVGYMWRHHPGLNRAFELVRNGALGDLFLVRIAIDNQLDAARRAEWAQFPGGVLFELGSHVIDATVRLLGRPERVTPFLRTLGSTADRLADANVAVLEYPRTTVVITSATLRHNAGSNRSFEFCGTGGNALLQPIEPPNLTVDLAAPSAALPKGRSTVPIPAYARYVGELAELAACVRGERQPGVSLDTERTVHETLLRAVGVL
jgi:predicted dehydrogenase